MMSLAWRRRAAALSFGVFAAFFGESLVATSCPMHDGLAAASMPSHADHAVHGSHQADAGSPDGGSQAPMSHSHGCTCLGTCVGATVAALAPEAPVTSPAVVATSVAVPAAALAAPHAAPQTRLPFAQPPPTHLARA